MATILTREPVPSRWNPGEWAGPNEDLTLREWEASVAASGFSEPLRTLLCEALLEPATPACKQRQQWPAARRVELCSPLVLRHTAVDTLREAALTEIAALWQIIDLEAGAIPGMLRGLLLAGFGARLRQTLTALERQPGGLSAEQELWKALQTLSVQQEQGAQRQAALREQRDQQHKAVWRLHVRSFWSRGA